MYRNFHILFASFICYLCHQASGFLVNPNSFSGINACSRHTHSDSHIKQVAIIGTGPAGASTAYYLKQFADKAGICFNVTIFERNSHIGGRVVTVNAHDDILQPVELGSTIFSDANPIIKNASDTFGLRSTEFLADDSFGVWNGREFLFTQEHDVSDWDLLRIFWRYGSSLTRAERLKKSILAKFRKLYEYPNFPFRSLTDSIHGLGLDVSTNMTGAELMVSQNIGPRYSSEFIQSSTRVAYGQNLDVIHGLLAIVCMAVEGSTTIMGGNWQIFDRMIRASKATTVLKTAVDSIGRSETNQGYNIVTSTKNAITNKVLISSHHFDTVVLAAPFQFSNITIEEGLLNFTPENIPYVKLHVTLFASPHSLNPAFFNLTDTSNQVIPATVLTTLPGDAARSPTFFSISKLRSVINPHTKRIENLYKIFSPNAIDASFLSDLLNITLPENFSTSAETISWYYPYIWNDAYPYAHPRTQFDPSEIACNFWYTSGMESFASTMETSALMGMNVARLITDEYLEEQQNALHTEK